SVILTAMRRVVGWRTLVGILAFPACVAAQDRPFVFTLTTPTDASGSQVRIDYEVGVGDQAFHQQTSNGPEQRLGIQASVGRLTFVGHVGIAATKTYKPFRRGNLFVCL